MLDLFLATVFLSILSLAGALFAWMTSVMMRARVSALEEHVQGIEARALSRTRRQAALNRWENEDQANAALESALEEQLTVTAKQPWWRKHGVQPKTRS